MKASSRYLISNTRFRGQSLIEFALVSVALVMLLFGVIEMCRLVLVYTTVANAARVGVRYATVHGTNNSVTCSQIASVINNYLAAATVQTGTASCVSSSPCPPGPACITVSPQTPGAPGTTVTVTVTYQYNPLITYFPINLNLASTSQGVIAF